MRLLVRASTVRAPSGPPGPRVYAFSREGEAGFARAADPEGLLSAADVEGEAGAATILYLRSDVEGEGSRCTAFVLALSREGEAGFAAPLSTLPTAYAYSRLLAVERMADLAAATFANHVVRGRIEGAWLKQASLPGGRIQHVSCYDLVFETLAVPPARLDHEIEAYDGTAGTLDVALRLPSWAVSVEQLLVRIRHGATL